MLSKKHLSPKNSEGTTLVTVAQLYIMFGLVVFWAGFKVI